MHSYPMVSSGFRRHELYMSLYLLDVTASAVTAIGGIVLLYAGHPAGWPILLMALAVQYGIEYTTAE